MIAGTHGKALIDTLRSTYDAEVQEKNYLKSMVEELTNMNNETMSCLHTMFGSLLVAPINEYIIMHSFLFKYGTPKIRIISNIETQMSVTGEYEIDICSRATEGTKCIHYICISKLSEKLCVECVVHDLTKMNVHILNYERLLANHNFDKAMSDESENKFIRKNGRCFI